MSNYLPGSKLAVLARWLFLVLAATQLSGCLSGTPRNGVPEDFATIAEVKGYPPDIRIWGDTLIALPPERLIQLREQRLKAAKSDPAIKPGEINALTLAGGGSSGAHRFGGLAAFFVLSGSITIHAAHTSPVTLAAGQGASYLPAIDLQEKNTSSAPATVLEFIVTPAGADFEVPLPRPPA